MAVLALLCLYMGRCLSRSIPVKLFCYNYYARFSNNYIQTYKCQSYETISYCFYGISSTNKLLFFIKCQIASDHDIDRKLIFFTPAIKFFNSAMIFFNTLRAGGGQRSETRNRGTDGDQKSEVRNQKSAEWKIVGWAVPTNRQNAFYLQSFFINATAFSNIRIPGVGPLPNAFFSRLACSFFRVQLG